MFKTLREKICSRALTRCPRDLKFVPRPPTTEGFVQAPKHNLPKSKRKPSQVVMANLKTYQFQRNYFHGKINRQGPVRQLIILDLLENGVDDVRGRIPGGQQQATSEKLRVPSVQTR